MAAKIAASEPTFNLPTGSASDFYLLREVNDSSEDNGKVIKKHGIWRYPFLTRRTGDSLVGTNEEITSSELRHGRTASKTKLGNASSSGSHDFEYSPETFDDEMEGAFRNKWVRLSHDGVAAGIAKNYLTSDGYIHVNGDPGTYNQEYTANKRITSIPLFYTDADTTYGLIKTSADVFGYASRAAAETAKAPLGKFVMHELHVGNDSVKYAFVSRIPISDKVVRLQKYNHVEVSEMSLNVTVNAIITGSLSLMGSNNPAYYTENAEKGKTRFADKIREDKDMAVSNADSFSSDMHDAAEKFVSAIRNTTTSTDTDQFTALEGFLYVNGHQLQFASDLTMDLNNNLQAVNAIFVKNAIANISPSLTVTGNITAYFTDGEEDSNGEKFGAADLKNLASQNKDVEILYAFQDKEDPETIYVFQIFKGTFSSPSESKDADNPMTLDLSYSSYGEMAVRCLRLAIPKIRDIVIDGESAIGSNEVSVTLYPNVPLDATKDADYVDASKDAYVFKNKEITYSGSGTVTVKSAAINSDGYIDTVLNLPTDSVFASGDVLTVKVTVNGTECEATVTCKNEVEYLSVGDNCAEVTVAAGTTIKVYDAHLSTAKSSNGEDYVLYRVDKSKAVVAAGDYTLSSSDESVVTVSNTDGTFTVVSGVTSGSAVITVAETDDDSTFCTFTVNVGTSTITDESE